MSIKGEVRLLRPQDVEEAYRLETEGYPTDEAASYHQLVSRQREAGDLFLGYFEGIQLIGFMCGTRYCGEHMKIESFTNHIASGDSVCVHSVVVDKERRRQGIALSMLQRYIKHVGETQTDVKRILLLCHIGLIPLYTRAGFTLVGKSDITHGQQSWFEMEHIL